MKKSDLIKTAVELQDKYVDLLWYARTSPENYNIKGVKQNIERIEKLYPKEVDALHSEEGNWQHGFHSGMVAALRYIFTMDDLGKEQADDEFPMLDT
jgi:hypothetical protein